MTKSEFTAELIYTIEGLCVTHLGDCYDVTTAVHKLVKDMTEDNDIEWDTEDEE